MSKKFTKNLDSKLMRYTAAAGAVAGVTAANGQVSYTDIDPDITINSNGQGVNLDIDNDATPDYVVAVFDTAGVTGTVSGIAYTFTYGGGVLQPQNSNSWLGFNSSSDTVATVLNANDNISSAGSVWSNAGSAYLEFQATYTFPAYAFGGTFGGGAWGGVTDKYAGLKFSTGGSTYYGWVRMDVSADGKSITIKDFAYETTPDAAILAGDMGAGVGVNELEGQIEVIGAVDQIIINNNTGSNGTVAVMNMNGQVVVNEAISGSKEVIASDALATGIYVVQVTVNDQTIAKKVYLR